jgi:hypothetical protein
MDLVVTRDLHGSIKFIGMKKRRQFRKSQGYSKEKSAHSYFVYLRLLSRGSRD